jgi:uncharacterized protein (DUF433 family)
MAYGSSPNVKRQESILAPSSRDLLSFYDIASAHVLMAMKAGGANFQDLREVVRGLECEYPNSSHPLLGREFYMFGKDVVLRKMGILLNMTRSRQIGMKRVMNKFLARIELDANLMPVRFSPLRTHNERGKGYIVIDPDFAYGRPVIKGTGIAAEIIARRKGSGESETRLAKDYRISLRAVREAVKHFPQQKAA